MNEFIAAGNSTCGIVRNSGHPTARARYRGTNRGRIVSCLALLLVFFLPRLLHSASPEGPWEQVPAELRAPLAQAAEKISETLRSEPAVTYRTDGRIGLTGLPEQPYESYLHLSWFLPGVDRDGNPVPAGKKRSRVYGDTYFSVGLVKMSGLSSDETVEKMLEGRSLSEAQRERQVEGFRIIEDLRKNRIAGAKKARDDLMAQADQLLDAHRQSSKPTMDAASALRDQRQQGIEACRARKWQMGLAHQAARQALYQSLPPPKRGEWYVGEDKKKIRALETRQHIERRDLDKECGDQAHKLLQQAVRMENSVAQANTRVSVKARELRKQAKGSYRAARKELQAAAQAKLEALEPKLRKIERDRRERDWREQEASLDREESAIKNRFAADAACMLGAARASVEEYRSGSASSSVEEEAADRDNSVLGHLSAECNPELRARMSSKTGRARNAEGSVPAVENPLAEETRQALEAMQATDGGRQDPGLPAAVERFDGELAFFAQETGKRLEGIARRREALEQSKIKALKQPPSKKKFRRNFPYPYELATRKFDAHGGQGARFEFKAAVHSRDRGRTWVGAYWPCGPYLVRVAVNLVKPVLKRQTKKERLQPGLFGALYEEWETAVDGAHEWVPFSDERLKQAEAIRETALESLGASGLCDGDGYFAWKTDFQKLLETNRNILAGTLADLDVFSGAIDWKYRQWMQSLVLEMRSFCLPDKEEQTAWDDLSWFTRYKKGVSARALGGRTEVTATTDIGAPVETREIGNYLGEPRESLSDEALAALRAARRRLREEIDGFRAMQDAAIQKALESTKGLWESTREQARKSGKRRPHLEGAADYWENRLRVLPAELYLAAHRPEKVRAEIEKVNLGAENASEELRLLWRAQVDQLEAAVRERQQPVADICDPRSRAKGLSAAGRLRARALFAARRALTLNPDNVAAAELIKHLDIHFIDLIGKKQAAAQQVASAAFRRYLEERGYDPAVPAGWSELAYELAYAFWATGPQGVLFFNKPLEMEERASNIGGEVAENHVSLLAIRSLRRNGMPFTEIRSITGKKLSEHMLLRSAGRQKLAQDKADVLAGGIRKLLADDRLTDLRALASDDGSEQRFVAAFAKEHYPGSTEVNTWPEWFLDAASPRNIALMFGPGAVVRAGGRWALTSPRWGNYYRVWEKGAGVARVAAQDAAALSMREAVLGTPSWLLSSPRLEPLVARLSGGRMEAAYKSAMTAVSDVIIRDQIAYHNMGRLQKGLQHAGAFVGATMVYGGALQIAEDQNWPWLATMVEVLSALSAEEGLVDALARNGIPTRLLKANLDRAERAVLMERRRLADYRRRLQAVGPNAGTPRAGSADIDLSGPHIPGVDGYKDFAYAEKRAKELGSKGGRSVVEQQEYEDALRDMGWFIERLDSAVKDMDGKIVRARAGMGQYENPVHPDLGDAAAPKYPRDVPNPDSFEPDTGYWDSRDYALTGVPFKQGDELFKKGGWQEAEEAYRAAHTAAGPRTVDQAVHIQRRLSLVERVKRASQRIAKRRKPGPSPAQEPIDIVKVGERLGSGGDLEVDLSRINLPQNEQSLNPVLFLKNKRTGKREFAFKILRPGAQADELASDAFASALLADEIMKKTGIRTPGAKVAALDVPEFQYADPQGTLIAYGRPDAAAMERARRGIAQAERAVDKAGQVLAEAEANVGEVSGLGAAAAERHAGTLGERDLIYGASGPEEDQLSNLVGELGGGKKFSRYMKDYLDGKRHKAVDEGWGDRFDLELERRYGVEGIGAQTIWAMEDAVENKGTVFFDVTHVTKPNVVLKDGPPSGQGAREVWEFITSEELRHIAKNFGPGKTFHSGNVVFVANGRIVEPPWLELARRQSDKAASSLTKVKAGARSLEQDARMQEGLLSRYVSGEDVMNLPVEEVLALKESYARHRLFRAWLGDYDAHLGNMKLGEDGHAWLFDVGLAQFDNFDGTTTDQTLRFLVNFRDRAPNHAGKWIRAMDDRVHIDTMKPVIAAIQELFSPEHEGRLQALIQAHFKDPAKANAVFHQLKARADLLEKVFEERFENVARKTPGEMQSWFQSLLSGQLPPL